MATLDEPKQTVTESLGFKDWLADGESVPAAEISSETVNQMIGYLSQPGGWLETGRSRPGVVVPWKYDLKHSTEEDSMKDMYWVAVLKDIYDKDGNIADTKNVWCETVLAKSPAAAEKAGIVSATRYGNYDGKDGEDLRVQVLPF